MAVGGLDQALTDLKSNKQKWAQLALKYKLDYLDRVRVFVFAEARTWVDAACQAKGIAVGSPLAGEEWLSGPYAVLTWINAVQDTLTDVAADREPMKKFTVRQRSDGQTVVTVYPHGRQERLLLNGVSAEVWMQPGTTPASLRNEVATFYKRPSHDGRLALVLGAGNIASIPALDVLYKLYAHGEVVILKLNPVNAYLGPIFERAFAPFVADGFLRFAHGAGDVGEYLTRHQAVETIHITGSEHTHDDIIYGSGSAGTVRKARDERLLAKPITSELGGVGPTIVVPGPWNKADFEFQAEHVATQKLHNNGFNCIASQVLVLPEGWDGSSVFTDAVRQTLSAAPARPSYYPGSDDRQAAAVAHHAAAETLGGARTLILDVDPNDRGAYAFNEEFFAPVVATTRLPGRDAAQFLRNAVEFANETLHGTLGANIIIHPKTARALGPVLDEAISALRYGTIAINAWTGVGYLTPRATWGAFPGHPINDAQSGIGVVHNALLFDRPEKTVVRGPFRRFPASVAGRGTTILPRPPWFVTNKTADVTGERLTELVADGKWWHVPGVLVSALRG
jgi:aldehyde dehydrogenase (NAD(P)+)